MHGKLICSLISLLEFFPIVTGLIMAEDWDVEAMLEAPYKKEVSLFFVVALFIFCIFYSYVIFPEISKHLKNNLLALSCRMNHWSLFLWITKQGSMHCHGVQVELLVVYITTGFFK